MRSISSYNLRKNLSVLTRLIFGGLFSNERCCRVWRIQNDLLDFQASRFFMLISKGLKQSFYFTFAISLSFVSGFASANPSGGQVAHGQAVISNPDAYNTVINQTSQKLITNWQTFSIAQAETTTFNQPNSSAIALNRVIGGDPSKILGSLKANGQVFISNPSGVLFGKNAQVNVHGLMATTHEISNEDFKNGNYKFIQSSAHPYAAVINQGTIEAASYVALFGGAVENSGTIVASLGSVSLAAGKVATLDFNGDGLISFQITEGFDGEVKDTDGNSLNDRVKNSGSIQANGGQVQLTAMSAANVIKSIVNNEGIIEANTVSEKGGRIFLGGGDNGVVSNSGSLIAKGNNAGEVGGQIIVTGETVALNNALVDVSGDAGGGTINIGGGWQGSDVNIHNATNTTADANTELKADAKTKGDGGTVVVWSDGTTEFHGNISATGGSESGDGGNAEVSGKEHLLITGHANLRAANGNFGDFLLDPGSVTIQDGANSAPSAVLDSFNDAYIIAQLSASNLEISTSNSTNNADETITIAGNTDITWGQATTLTLTAGRNIIMNTGAQIVNTSTSATTFDAVVMKNNRITTGNFSGIDLRGATITSRNGDITLEGIGGVVGGDPGVHLSAGSIISSTGTGPSAAKINVTGTGGGVLLNGNSVSGRTDSITSVDGDITVNGTGDAGFFNSSGVKLLNVARIASTGAGVNAAKINITGTGGTNTLGGNYGVELSGTSRITSVDGDIAIIGTGGTVGNQINDGIHLAGSSEIMSSGAAKINLTGTGGGAGTKNRGVLLTGTPSITSVDGDITVIGTGGVGSNNYGVFFFSGGKISSTGTDADAAKINVTGTTGIFMLSGSITSADGDITVIGGTESNNNIGVFLGIARITSTGTGVNAAKINITGSGNSRDGIFLDSTSAISSIISSVDGDITVTGSGGAGSYISGVTLDKGSQITSIGTGTHAAKINVTGTGGAGSNNEGVRIKGLDFTNGTPSLVSSIDGDITVIGTGGAGGSNNHGVYVDDGGQIVSTGTASNAAKINVTGTGGTGSGDLNHGVFIGIDGGWNAGTSASKISSTSGEIVLVAAKGSGANSKDFTNSGGATAVNSTNDRWLIYSSDPANNTYGGLLSGNQALFNKTFVANAPASITQTGNRYVFATAAPNITFTSLDTTITAGEIIDLSSNFFVTSPTFVNAATFGNVFTQDNITNTFTGSPAVTSAGTASTANLADSPYSIDVTNGSLVSTTGYGFVFNSTGVLTVKSTIDSTVLLGLTPTGSGDSPFGSGGSSTTPTSSFPLRIGIEEDDEDSYLYPWEQEWVSLFGSANLNMPPQMRFF